MDRRLWAAQEDEVITKLVQRHGTKKWPLISEQLAVEGSYERTGKQCRQRWYNHLSPQISHTKWSQADEERLFEAHHLYGNKWKNISKLFEGRTDNAIKNHFYSTLRKSLRRINKLHGEKNSTLKMRLIKPHVLSEILSDIKLTEMIFTLGRHKPNKHQQRPSFQASVAFENVFSKLIAINTEYEHKKRLRNENKRQKIFKNDGDCSVELLGKEKCGTDSQRTDTFATIESVKSPEERISSTEKINYREMWEEIPSIKQLPSCSIPKRKRIKKAKSKVIPKMFFPAEPLQFSDETSLSPTKRRRTRKQINYYSMHVGWHIDQSPRTIQKCKPMDQLAQSVPEEEKQEEEGRNYEDGCNSFERLKQSFRSNQYFGSKVGIQSLQEILEEEQPIREEENFKSYQKNCNFEPSMFNCELIQSKPDFLNFQLRYPSPTYARKEEDLVIIGTHVKLFATPRAARLPSSPTAENIRRKISEDQYIEQVLEINFDADFAMHVGDEEQWKE